MIRDLPEVEIAWLRRFFSAPNGIDWDTLASGSAPREVTEQVRPWIETLVNAPGAQVLVLPFLRQGVVTGWYAAPRTPSGAQQVGEELRGWLGPTYLRMLQATPPGPSDPMAQILRARFGGAIWRFTGPDAAGNARIAERLADYAAVVLRRPASGRRDLRPVGSIRADFDRAVLGQDERSALALIDELRRTGRLNEENLRYLDVRLKAGLGLWPQIARDKWLVSTLSDLPLPPQTLADLIEALYRTYIDDLEQHGDVEAILKVFDQEIAGHYPRLFASRRGVRAPRVLKAFLLFERLQPAPSVQIMRDLMALLPEAERTSAWVQALEATAAEAPPRTHEDDEAAADAAYDDLQFDRAFELYLALSPSRKIVGRLLSTVLSIGAADARDRFARWFADLAPEVTDGLPAPLREKIETVLRQSATELKVAPLGSWMAWAQALAAGEDLEAAERAVREQGGAWNVQPYLNSEAQSRALADMLANLAGPAADVFRRSFAPVFSAFFADVPVSSTAVKPIASVLFMLLAMDENPSGPDLNLMAQLLSKLLGMGVAPADYLTLVRDLRDVQSRVASYAHLPWSLDVAEALAVAPSPSDAARDARLNFFLRVVGDAQSFAHRLRAPELAIIETLTRDYGLGQDAIDALRRSREADALEEQLSLQGKMIGIYTLAEAAGLRSRRLLEEMFPTCRVEVNSDLVCTSALAHLAQSADIFVFAWKSSSHQAFYCVKDALTKCEPTWAAGKGTASIVRAVLEAVG